MHGLGGGFDVVVVGADDAGFAFAENLDFDVDTFGRDLLNVLGVFTDDVVGVHVGDHAHGDFGGSFGGDDGFCAGSGEASGHAVDFQRGTSPGAVEDGVARLAC